MTDRRLAATSNRSLVGVMNEFSRLAETYRTTHRAPELIELAVWLAEHRAAPSTAGTSAPTANWPPSPPSTPE